MSKVSKKPLQQSRFTTLCRLAQRKQATQSLQLRFTADSGVLDQKQPVISRLIVTTIVLHVSRLPRWQAADRAGMQLSPGVTMARGSCRQ